MRQPHNANSLFQSKVTKKEKDHQNRRIEIKTKIKGNEVDSLYITSLVAGGWRNNGHFMSVQLY